MGIDFHSYKESTSPWKTAFRSQIADNRSQNPLLQQADP